MRHVIYTICKERHLILKLWSGSIGKDAFIAYERAPYLDPDFPPTPPNGLCDITTADFSSLTPEDIASVISVFKEFSSKSAGSKVAIVATGQFDKARQFESVVAGAGIDVITFTDLPTACTWLGVPFKEIATWFAWARAELDRQPL